VSASSDKYEQFNCPKCGGHEWGTWNATAKDLSEMTGHCQSTPGCTFTWNRAKDSKYFKTYNSWREAQEAAKAKQ
jgi:hypothetical protein